MAKAKPKANVKPTKTRFSRGQKDDVAHMLQSLAVTSILGFVTYASGHLVLSNGEAILLFIAMIALSVCGILLRKE